MCSAGNQRGEDKGVLYAADLISMHDISLDIGPTRRGLIHGQQLNENFPGVVTGLCRRRSEKQKKQL